MILKGNARGGGQNLATHLMNEFSNDRVEILDLDGSVAQDLHGAFAEWYAQSKATKGKKYLFSLSVNPDEKQRRLTRDEYLDLADRVGKKLKLAGQPRAIVMHEKQDEQGIPRQHAHIVWSRTDAEQSKFVHLSEFKLKLRAVAREFAKEHRLELPPGMRKDGLTDRFERKAKTTKLSENQQKERSGLDKAGRMEAVTEAWKTTRTGEEFIKALADRDYYIARGDSRSYVVVDLAGEVHSLGRQLKGVKAAEIKARLSGTPPDKLPGVEKAQDYARQMREHRKKVVEKEKAPAAAVGPTPDERRAALHQQQQQRQLGLAAERENLKLRQAKETGQLIMLQATINAGIIDRRPEGQSRAVIGFLKRITGVGKIIDFANRLQDKQRDRQQQNERAALQQRQESERRDLDRRQRAFGRLDRREAGSLETAIRREDFQKISGPEKTREGADKGSGGALGKEPPTPTQEQGALPAAAAGRLAHQAMAPESKRAALARIFNRVKGETATPPAPEKAEKADPVKPAPAIDRAALRAAFDAAAKKATDPEKAPAEPGSLAEEFRRRAALRERDDKDLDRDRHFRQPRRDSSVRR